MFVAVTGGLIYLHRRHLKEHMDGGMEHGGGLTLKRAVVYLFLLILAGGLLAYALTGGTA